MNHIPHIDRRRDFSIWLRTGRPPTRTADGIELKFNPYHDPRNGQFTFAPGGPRSLARVVISHRRPKAVAERPWEAMWRKPASPVDTAPESGGIVDAVYRPDGTTGSFRDVQFRPPRVPRGSNSRAFEDPMTLEQTFPGLRDAPGGSVISLLDNLFDITGPTNELMAAMTRERSALLMEQITALDPNWKFQSLGFPATWEGQKNQLNDLRMQRAASFVKIRGEQGPMQVETTRVIQDIADRAYVRAVSLYENGQLKGRLSKEEAIGTYVDNAVRTDLRMVYRRYSVKSIGSGIRVNRREYDTSKPETTYRRPDAGVGNIAYDVTLSRKTLKNPQVRGFFNADFRPEAVVIIRPRQLGPGNSYIITRPETEK